MSSVDTLKAGSSTPNRENLWGGGRSPFGVPTLKLGMWFFLASDTLTFASFIAAYGVSRSSSAVWPVASEIFGISLVSLMTFILICSSVTMATAVGAAQKGDFKKATRFLFFTILGGLFFLGSQIYEWTHLIQAGGRTFENPWGSALFTSSFFTITGFHGLHVAVGVLYLSILAFRARKGIHSFLGIEVAGLYWHFVDVVWVFIFTLFYLL